MKTTEELYRIQEEIASKAIIEDKLNPKIKLIAGADQAFFSESKDEVEDKEKIISAVVVLEYPSMKFIDYSYSVMPVDFPYIPGLLSFREAPSIINAFHALENTTKPDLLVIDGCGINHPRFAGLATHVGVVLDVATVGVAKNILCGSGEVPMTEGEARLIKYKGKEIGYYLKSKKGCRPIIVAPGHKISLQSSLRLIKNCIRKHKLPEPTRMAHLYANKIKKEFV
ncbi:MAG: endonuclease V [Halobacteriota archaeon]